jgi:hypothetical protein
MKHLQQLWRFVLFAFPSFFLHFHSSSSSSLFLHQTTSQTHFSPPSKQTKLFRQRPRQLAQFGVGMEEKAASTLTLGWLTADFINLPPFLACQPMAIWHEHDQHEPRMHGDGKNGGNVWPKRGKAGPISISLLLLLAS